MSDVTIPEDIRRDAITALDAYRTATGVSLLVSFEDQVGAVALAILAERERCAKIADACFADIKGYPHDFGALDTGGLRAAEKIAKAIRSPHPNDKGDGK